MIVSMKTPYESTARVLKLISSISIKLSELNANYLNMQSTQLGKFNKSSATASRDLLKDPERIMIEKIRDKNKT